MAFIIEKNVKIPNDGKLLKQRENKYPFKDMEIGDSFVFEFSHIRELTTFKVSCRIQKHRFGKTFYVRIIEENSKARCWRTA